MFNLADYIIPRARRVVELGCGDGSVGEKFLRVQPAAEYFGFDTDSDNILSASARVTYAAVSSPETVDYKRFGISDGSCDMLIISGEYFRGITSVRLKKLAAMLKDDGELLLLLPNSSYMPSVLETLAARGESERACRRFIAPTKEEMKGILQEAGFSAAGISFVQDAEGDKSLRESDEMKNFVSAFVEICKLNNWNVETNIWARYWLIRAVRAGAAIRDRMLVHVTVGESVACARVRVNEPNEFIRTERGIDAISENGKYTQQLDEPFNKVVFIRQRLIFLDYEQGKRIIDVLRAKRYLFIQEMDDNPVLWSEDYNKSTSRYLDFIGAHAIQTSTDSLADTLREYNPYVKVFRNELRELPPRRDYDDELNGAPPEAAPVTIFFGALNRSEEWTDIMPVLNDAIKKYGAMIRFKVISDKKFFSELHTDNKEFIEKDGVYGGQFVPYEDYVDTIRSSDISLLPLRDTVFNRTKSDLKFIESAGNGAVVIASPTVYADTVRDGSTGFIYHDAREFEKILCMLIDDRARRIETAKAAYRYVKEERLLSQHYMERIEWYREMFSRYDELDKALQKRMEQVEGK